MKSHFEKEGIQESYSKTSKLPLKGVATPFEYLIAGFNGCLYLTIEALANKKDIKYTSIDIESLDTRSESKAKDLVALDVQIKVKDVIEQEAMNKTIEKAFKFATVGVTLSRSVKINYNISYE